MTARHILPIYANALDGVKVDECGNVVDGADSYMALSNEAATDDPIARITLTPNYFTPPDITQEVGNGGRVIIPGEPTLESYTVALDIIGLLFDPLTGLTGDRAVVETTDVIGAVFGSRASSNRWSMRFWQKSYATDCSETTWIVHHLAMVRSWQKTGSWEAANGISGWSFQGLAVPNANYGDGPHTDWATAWFDEEIYGAMESTTIVPPTHQNELSVWPIV